MGGRQKYQKEFKLTVAQRVAQGTPVKEVARVYKIRPTLVREWRDELRDLGVDAFSRNGIRRFTKEFREAAVRRIEAGTPVKEVARACRLLPNILRRWRDALRELGDNAFADSEPKTRTMIFRLTEEEHDRLMVTAKGDGAESLSDFVRSQLLCDTDEFSTHTSNNRHIDILPKTKAVTFRLTEDEYDRLKATAKAAGARSLAKLARFRLVNDASGLILRTGKNEGQIKDDVRAPVRGRSEPRAAVKGLKDHVSRRRRSLTKKTSATG